MNDVLIIKDVEKLLTQEDIFSEIKHLLNSPIEKIVELSEGNVNQVFRILMENGKTFIAKYAPPFAYRYRDIKIANERNNYETMVLKKFGSNSKHYPEIYFSSPSLHMTLMEDLKNCQTLRDALIEGIIFPNLVDDVVNVFSTYLEEANENDLENTSFSYKDGIDELQNITKLFVFENPFGENYPSGFICQESNLHWVRSNIFENNEVQLIRKKLQNNYYSSTECLLHGDLHTGSILINQENMYIIDPEFSKLGPVSFDLGMLIANLIMIRIASDFYLETEKTKQVNFKKWLTNVVEEIWIKVFPILGRDANHINTLKQETIGYCGIEIIRRVIGEAQIKDFTMITDLEKRAKLEMEALQIGVSQLLNYEKTYEISNYMTEK